MGSPAFKGLLADNDANAMDDWRARRKAEAASLPKLKAPRAGKMICGYCGGKFSMELDNCPKCGAE